jgi:radical SAM superfamily enzyme YgiQ (UPF0313 family)
MASLLSSLKANSIENLNIVSWSFNVSEPDFEKNWKDKIKSNDLNYFEKIAISVFVWSESVVKKLLEQIKSINYKGTIILGGRQIAGDEDNLINDYPLCKVFVIGYGENCIKEAIDSNKEGVNFLYGNYEKLDFPSPCLSGELIVKENQRMVRMETKRGCPYSCKFCAHKDLINRKIYEFPYERIISELNLFKSKKVKKINIIDPVFNIGKQYLNILEYIYKENIDSKISIQVRLEKIKGEEGEKFIEICSKLKVVLEFGIQSLIKRECEIIGRRNSVNGIERIIKTLKNKKIDYEVSLIYGLPEQSVETFRETIVRLQSMGCEKTRIKMYPLMLLKGTELYKEKDKWGLKEESSECNISLVVESNSFSKSEWKKMQDIAGRSTSKN